MRGVARETLRQRHHLVVDVFDARTNQAIWHGVAASAAPDDPTSIAHAAERPVVTMVGDFPPASQGPAVQP